MQTILELLNKIRWDKRENPEDYVLVYVDLRKEKEISYSQIKRLEGNFMVLDRESEEVEIPLHRIREVRKKGKTVWKR